MVFAVITFFKGCIHSLILFRVCPRVIPVDHRIHYSPTSIFSKAALIFAKLAMSITVLLHYSKQWRAQYSECCKNMDAIEFIVTLFALLESILSSTKLNSMRLD